MVNSIPLVYICMAMIISIPFSGIYIYMSMVISTVYVLQMSTNQFLRQQTSYLHYLVLQPPWRSLKEAKQQNIKSGIRVSHSLVSEFPNRLLSNCTYTRYLIREDAKV